MSDMPSLSALYLQDPKLAAALRARLYAEQLQKAGGDTSPVQSPWQAASRVVQGLLGGYEEQRADADLRAQGDAQAAAVADRNARYTEVLGGGAQPTPMSQAVAGQPAQPTGQGATIPDELRPYFEEASRNTGIPVHVLAAVGKQESGFRPGVVGDDGKSTGVMQVQARTAANPGYGVPSIDPTTLTDPRTNILFGAQYLAARGKAAGVTDWNDPTQRAAGLKAYNGGGDPNYVQNVERYMPVSGGASGPAAGPAQIDPVAAGNAKIAQANRLAVMAAEDANSRIPAIKQQAQIRMEQARMLAAQGQHEVTQAQALANRNMNTVVIQDPTTGKNYVTEMTPNGPGRRLGLAQNQEDKGPLSGPDKQGETMRTIAPLIIAGKATPEQIETFHQAADLWSKASFDPATGKMVQGGGFTPNVQKALDVLAAQRQQAVATGNNPLQQPPTVETTPAGTTRTSQPPNTTPQALEDYRKAQVEASRLNNALDEFMTHLKSMGGTNMQTFFNNPRDPQAVKLNTLHDRVQEVLRSEAFMNTGVLQPAEAQMVREKLLDPRTWRGWMASDKSYEALADVLKNTIKSGLDARRKLAGLPPEPDAQPSRGTTTPQLPPGFVEVK